MSGQLTSLTVNPTGVGQQKSMLPQGARITGWPTQPCLQSGKVSKVIPTSYNQCGATVTAMDLSQRRFLF